MTGTSEPTVDPAIDPALLCLLAAAERGEETPRISLLTGSWLVQGQPTRSRDFVSHSADVWWAEVAATSTVKEFRGTEDEKVALIRRCVDPLSATVNAWESPGVPVLTLLWGVIAGGVGATFHMPTLRVPLSSVQAWWVTRFGVTQPQEGGGVVGFGMVGVDLPF